MKINGNTLNKGRREVVLDNIVRDFLLLKKEMDKVSPIL